MKWYLILTFMFATSGLNAQSLNFEAKDLNNNWISLQSLSGEKFTVIDFWATWCKPCVNALPKINNLYLQFKDQGISFIGVCVDGPRNQAKVKPFTQSLGIQYPIVLDAEQDFMDDLNASVMPTLIILNSQGKEVYRHEGFQVGDEKVLAEKMNSLLTK